MDLTGSRMTPKLIDSLYVEAMVLADEARTYFDREGREQRQTLDPLVRVAFSCESLKVTTRLMHILAWLLSRRAIEAGQVEAGIAARPQRLGDAPDSDPALIEGLPDGASELIESSRELYARIKRLDEGVTVQRPASPARSLMSLLERSI
jgi:regulator of CtrA degradation